tara:strand:+ start:2886 stop:4622 length:1737 start_codon:yes stop_codon:yes gene_type:complete
MAFKTESLERGDIITVTGCAVNSYGGQYGIMPVTKGGYSNTHVLSGSGDYDGGDRVIGFPNGYEVDGDLLFTVGWGDGFAVRRLNNDGTLTKIFQDTYFLWRDTASTYNHLQSVAIDKVNQLGVVMTYNVEGYTTFDYSGCLNGGTTFVKDARPTHSTPDAFIGSQNTGGGYVNRVGTSYTSGIAAAGEWIYASDHDSHHYKKIMRRNLNTGVEERLDQTSSSVYLSGSGIIDRNGYRGCIFYDEVNDRIFQFTYYNANFTMVTAASTASPKTVWCDLGDAGVGDDGYEQGLHISDPVNAPNRMWVGGSGRYLDIDITPCFTGGDPTIHNQISLTSSSNNIVLANNGRMGNKYQATSGTPMTKIPGYPNYIRTYADRDTNMVGGWLDTENNKSPGSVRYNDTTEDTTTGGRGRTLRYSYDCPAVLMSSANGTKYWVKMGYSNDGHRFIVYEESDDPYELIGNWELTYGTYTLANSANIDECFVSNMDQIVAPSNCTLTVYVSNNNGSSWETLDVASTTAHRFQTTGTQLRVKLTATGHPDKAPYYMGFAGPLAVHYKSVHAAAKDSSIKYKVTRSRLS